MHSKTFFKKGPSQSKFSFGKNLCAQYDINTDHAAPDKNKTLKK